jgi:hypothetical protein
MSCWRHARLALHLLLHLQYTNCFNLCCTIDLTSQIRRGARWDLGCIFCSYEETAAHVPSFCRNRWLCMESDAGYQKRIAHSFVALSFQPVIRTHGHEKATQSLTAIIADIRRKPWFHVWRRAIFWIKECWHWLCLS